MTRLLALLCFALPIAARAQVEDTDLFSIEDPVPLSYLVPGQTPGYLADVSEERSTRFVEVILTPPPSEKKAPISEVIFNSQLSAEFKRKYREIFGQIDTESIVYQPSLTNALDNNQGANTQTIADQTARQNFAAYMERRLIEWHTDNFMKTDPNMRPIYEVKDKLSNINVQVSQQVKFNLKYNLSDNTMDLILVNPYIESKIEAQMARGSLLPTAPQEEKLMLQKQINKKWRSNSTVYNNDGVVTQEIVRILPQGWSVSQVTTAAYKAGGTSTRDTKYGINVARSF